MTRRVRRSGLMMPINTPRFVNSAWRRNSDSIDFDLEDSVPQAQKEHARSLVKQVIPLGLKGGADVSVRINTSSVEADVQAAVWPGVTRISRPKTEHGWQIQRLDQHLDRLERERGIRPGVVEITAMIESAKGIANAYEIASASPRVKSFGGGRGYDMSLDLGVEMFVGFDQFVYGVGECELVARALGLEPNISVFISDTTGSVSDADATYERAVASFKAGGRSGGGLHPNVVEPQNRALTPTQKDIDEAKHILAFFSEMGQRGAIEGELSGRTVDKYEAARAAELIEWAELCALKDAHKARAQEIAKAGEEAES